MIGPELGRRDLPEFAVEASVVEPVDVFGSGELDVDHRLPAAPGSHHRVADALGLEQRVERLGHRVVVRIALGPDARDGLSLGQPLGVANRSILNSAVAVVGEAGDVLASPVTEPQTHVEGVEGEVGAQAGETCQPTTMRLKTSKMNAT